MVKKTNKKSPIPEVREFENEPNIRAGTAVEMQMDAHRITSAMGEAGRVKDERNRRQLAENLGKILSKRKEHLNLSELVVDAGVSENPDPSRLNRFRILPGRKLSKLGVRRLSQDPLAYVNLAKAAALMNGEDPAALVQELVIGTKFEVSGLENVSVEPFEQILTLIEKKIAAINSKYDLESYFRKVRELELLPVWTDGPNYNGQIASRVISNRPEPRSWSWPDQGTDGLSWHLAESEILPSVPLCRIAQEENFKATVRINNFKDDDATIFRRKRVFLSIGMFTLYRENGSSVVDKKPSPYLVTVDELWFDFSWETTDVAALAKETGRDVNSLSDYWVAGDLVGYVEPESPEFTFEPHDFEIPNDGRGQMGIWLPWSDIERLLPLNLSTLRKFSGREGFFCGDGDALDRQQKIGSTFAPIKSLLANMESQLLYGRRTKDKPDDGQMSNFLDLLESDAERLTSSLTSWNGQEEKKVATKHKNLLEQYTKEAEQIPSTSNPNNEIL